MRRAKIVCTLGPAVTGKQRVRQLIDAGMNVARMNMSHGTHEEHRARYQEVREAAEEAGVPICIFADLQGPKIRLGNFADGPVMLERDATFTITTRDVLGDQHLVSTTYPGLPGDVRPGEHILIDDGKVALECVQVTDTDVVTRVVVPGPVSNHKGLNLPGVAVSVPALTDKDTADLRWALEAGVDMVALSFVRSAEDVHDVRKVMTEAGRKVPVIAKIEKPQAVQNLDAIIRAFDAVMIARGDLGVELPLEEVPLVQKRAIELARVHAKPVIVATQVLESMIQAPRPTRAEASDVANAVLDGTDALMLSGETSVGAYPVEAVRTMAKIIESTEQHGLERIGPLRSTPRTRGGAVTWAADQVGRMMDVDLLVTFTQSGDSARRMSRLRSKVPVVAFTPVFSVACQLALSWGIDPKLGPEANHTDEMVMFVDRALMASDEVSTGDIVIIVAGSPPGIPGSTNAMRIHNVGDAVLGIAPAYRTVYSEVDPDEEWLGHS